MAKIFDNFSPLVSIIMATYNRAKFLSRSIDSLLKQTYKDWELIIIDDGSSDNTFEIVDKYITLHQNIRYLKHSHRKLALSRNTGIAASIGKYLTFLDSDDEYKENHLQLRIDFMNEHPEIDIVHGGLEIIGSPYVADKNNPNQTIHLDQCAVGGTFLGKRNVFLELDGFKNIAYSEDSEFLERAKQKFKICKVEFPTYIYRRNIDDSITNQQLKKYEDSSEQNRTKK